MAGEADRRDSVIDYLMAEVRRGKGTALGELFQACRAYLLLVANEELDRGLRGKVGPSDLVQETFLLAQANWEGFRGGSEAELLAWLRRILHNQLIDVRRRYLQSEKRQLSREVPIHAGSPDDSGAAAQSLTRDMPSPGARVVAREQAEALQLALDRLPDEQREVIRLRNLERLGFAEVGEKMRRSPEAARKLWARAIEKLQQMLESADGS